MKTMTCQQLGGKCEQELSAETWDDMVQAMTKHVIEKHPDVAKEMEQMHKEDTEKWSNDIKSKWDATPEIGSVLMPQSTSVNTEPAYRA